MLSSKNVMGEWLKVSMRLKKSWSVSPGIRENWRECTAQDACSGHGDIIGDDGIKRSPETGYCKSHPYEYQK
jgi:hypothetical protein